MEYISLIDQANEQTDSLRRLAYVSIETIASMSTIEKNNTKPFNALLGETYELITPQFRYIAEQVSHHPPITAYEC